MHFPLSRFLISISRDSVFRDAPDQIIGYGLVEWKLNRAFGYNIVPKLRFKLFNALRAGVKTDVMLISGKVHQVAVEGEGGDAVPDLFPSLRRDGADQRSDLVQNGLHLSREKRDVFVNSFVGEHVFHGSSILVHTSLEQALLRFYKMLCMMFQGSSQYRNQSKPLQPCVFLFI